MIQGEDHFINKAIANENQTVLHGPYFNPNEENNFYALTLSQVLHIKGTINGVLNHDLNLDFSDEYDEFINFNSSHRHYFVTNQGIPLFHSKVMIMEDQTTLIKTEFSKTNESLKFEPDSNEVSEFRDTILPKFVDASQNYMSKFKKYDLRCLISMHL